VLVVAENLIRRPRVQIGQGRSASPDLQNLRGQAASRSFATDVLQALLGRTSDGRRDGLASQGCKLAHGLLRRWKCRVVCASSPDRRASTRREIELEELAIRSQNIPLNY
jgi:hypothetical protein